jgi:hypothetical protein
MRRHGGASCLPSSRSGARGRSLLTLRPTRAGSHPIQELFLRLNDAPPGCYRHTHHLSVGAAKVTPLMQKDLAGIPGKEGLLIRWTMRPGQRMKYTGTTPMSSSMYWRGS